MENLLTKREIYKHLKQLTSFIETELNNEMRTIKLTVMQAYLLLYIRKQYPHEIYATDIQNDFNLAKSTVSEYIKVLKKKGYIKVIQCHDDERHKGIIASQKLLDQSDNIEKMISDAEKNIYADISINEFSPLVPLKNKIMKNNHM